MTTTAIKRRKARRQASYAGDPFFEISESVALLEQATESNQNQIRELAETTNKAIQESIQNSSRQYREVTILIEKGQGESRSEIKALANEFSISRRPNYLLWLAGFSAIAILIGAAYKISDLQTQVTMAPVVTTATANASLVGINRDNIQAMSDITGKLRADLDSNSARDEVSEKDRQKLNQHAEKADDRLSKSETDNQVLHTKLVEVETQMDAAAQFAGTQFAEQQRKNADFQNSLAALGAKMPPYPYGPWYMPNISNRDGHQSR